MQKNYDTEIPDTEKNALKRPEPLVTRLEKLHGIIRNEEIFVNSNLKLSLSLFQQRCYSPGLGSDSARGFSCQDLIKMSMEGQPGLLE